MLYVFQIHICIIVVGKTLVNEMPFANVLPSQIYNTYYNTYTVYWESSAKESVHEFCKSGSIRGCFLHFLSRLEFLYMRLPESRKFSDELWQRR